MDWLIEWEYYDPSDEQIREGKHVLEEVGAIDEAWQYVIDNLPTDHLTFVKISDYTK